MSTEQNENIIGEVKLTGLPLRVGGTFIDGSSATGQAIVNGKRYYWDMHDYCGPLFTDKDGEPLKRQPGSRHPVWPAFNEWLKEHQSTKEAARIANKAKSS